MAPGQRASIIRRVVRLFEFPLTSDFNRCIHDFHFRLEELDFGDHREKPILSHSTL